MNLPKQDDFGHYWLNQERGSVIFLARPIEEKRAFLLLINNDDGFVFDGPNLKRFPTAQAAARAWCDWHDAEIAKEGQ